MLHQFDFEYAEFPELIDLAVINSGLGVLQSNFGFVNSTGSFWDSTNWEAVPRPFLDTSALAYANAVAAWIRGEKNPAWANELPKEVQRPMRKSLKYLSNTNDSFFNPSTAGHALMKQSQADWLQTASEESTSKQVVAIRHIEFDESLGSQQEALLLDKLQSPVRSVVLHAISAVASPNWASERVVSELQLLATNRDDEIRAKAMIALAKLGQIDDITVDCAAKMVGDSVKHVAFAGVFALSTLESVPDHALRAVERGFYRALQTCDYEFVGLFTVAFNRWLDDPKSYFEQLLRDDQPDYLEIALDALEDVREESVV